MRRLLGLGHQSAQVRLGPVAQIVLLDGAVAKIEKPQPKPEFAGPRALDHAVPLQNHQEAVCRALVQLQRGRNLRQAQRHIAFSQQIQYGKRAVESLNLIGTLRGSVSHIGPLYRLLASSPASQNMGLRVKRPFIVCGSATFAPAPQEWPSSCLRDFFARRDYSLPSGTRSPSPGARNKFA